MDAFNYNFTKNGQYMPLKFLCIFLFVCFEEKETGFKKIRTVS